MSESNLPPPHWPPPDVQQFERRPPRRGAVVVVIALALTALLAISGGLYWWFANGNAPMQTTLEKAVDECIVVYARTIEMGDDGKTLSLDHVSAEDYDDGVEWDELACVLESTDAPDRVTAQIKSTRALDGRQEAKWQGYAAFWTYHPDDGLYITIYET